MGELESEGERKRKRDRHRHTHNRNISSKRHLRKMKAKKATGPCPELPRAASRRSPPARQPARPVLQSARPRGRPRPPRSFEISEGCFPRRPRPRHPGSASPRKAGNSRVVRCRRRGGSAQGDSLQHTQNVNAKASKVTGLSPGKCREKRKGVGFLLFHSNIHTPISYLLRNLCK